MDGFWSISVYNAQGHYEKNAQGAYTFNSITAKPSAAGSITLHVPPRAAPRARRQLGPALACAGHERLEPISDDRLVVFTLERKP